MVSESRQEVFENRENDSKETKEKVKKHSDLNSSWQSGPTVQPGDFVVALITVHREVDY